MATRSERLNRLVIGSPCTTSWETMDGEGARRFCAECQREVYDFAQMTAASIHAELHARRGRMCARMTRHGGRLLTAPAVEPPQAAAPPARWRGATVAATLVTAWLAAANAAAQPSEATPAAVDTSTAEPEAERSPARRAHDGASGAVLGRVIDEKGTPVAGAEVSAANALDGSVQTVATGSDGSFRFAALSAGMYDLTGYLEGHDLDFYAGIVVQPGEQLRADFTARPEVVTSGGISVGESPLRQLFERSELVVSAVLGPSTVVEREDERLTVLTELRVGVLFKGTISSDRAVVYRHWEYDEEGRDWAAEYEPGTRIVAFLEPDEGAAENDGRVILEAAEWGAGMKRLSDAERTAYESRLEALARLGRRAERRGEKDPDEIVEWLVSTTEEPLTRGDAVDELAYAAAALADRAAAAQASVEVTAADLQRLVDRFRGSGGMLSAEPRPAFLGAALTVDHRQRLTAALVATEGLSDSSFTLFQLVRRWDADLAKEWLVRQLGAAESKWDAEEDASWWLESLAEQLGDEGLQALVTESIEREEEVEDLWPGDDSEETRKLRQERQLELRRELRQRFAVTLAASPDRGARR